MKTCKITFILGSTELGGAERQAILLASELIKRDYECDFILFGKQRGSASSLLKEYNIKYHITPHPPSRFKILEYVRLFRFSILLTKLKSNILMPYTFIPNVYTALLKRLLFRHKLCIWNQRDEGLDFNDKSLTRFALKNVDFFIANSEGALKALCYYNISLSNSRIVHNGILPQKIALTRSLWRNENGFSEEVILIGMLANIHENKDHITLIKAFDLFLKRNEGVNAYLLLAGRKDDYYLKVKESIDATIINKVLFLGKVSDTASFLNALDISVLSSRSEGLSNAVIETINLSIPFTGSKINGIIEALGCDYIDYLANAGDPADLCQKMEMILFNNELKDQLVKRNHMLVRSEFSIEKLTENTIEILNNFHGLTKN